MTDIATAPEGVDAAETESETDASEASAYETEEAADASEAEPEDGDEGEDGEGNEAEPEVEDVEYDLGGGQKLKVKANATAKEVLEQAQAAFKAVEGNFTRKQQAVAEQAKSIQAREQAAEKLMTLNGEALHEFSRGQQIKSEVEQLKGYVTQARAAFEQAQYGAHHDPEAARRASDQYRLLSDKLRDKQADLEGVIAKVSQIENGMSRAQEAEMARRAAEGEAILERRIKGFSQKVPEIIDYVSATYGIDKTHAAKVWKADPATAEMAYKAMMYDRMTVAGKKPGGKPAPAISPKPVVPMKATGTAKAPPDQNNMTPAQMAKFLNLPSGRR